MPLLVWEPRYDVGVPLIDSQHRLIVGHINQLQEAIEQQDREEVMDVIEQLVDYTIAHFGFEEAMQEQGQYPHLDAHRKIHREFTRKVERYKARFESGEDVSRQLLSELKNWFLNHIQKEDVDFAPFLKNNVGRETFSAALSRFFS